MAYNSYSGYSAPLSERIRIQLEIMCENVTDCISTISQNYMKPVLVLCGIGVLLTVRSSRRGIKTAKMGGVMGGYGGYGGHGVQKKGLVCKIFKKSLKPVIFFILGSEVSIATITFQRKSNIMISASVMANAENRPNATTSNAATINEPRTLPPSLSSDANRRHAAYHLEPARFVSGLAECILDSSCHIIYQHVAKTGGTGVESLMFSILGNRRRTCCGELMLHRFYAKPGHYCLNRFQSYEVLQGFDRMVQTCEERFYKSRQHRLIVLVSLREPIEWTLSGIHQMCNKRINSRNKETKEACLACNFDSHSDFWLNYTQRRKQEYLDLHEQHTTNGRATNATRITGLIQHHDHYWVDTMNMSDMFRDLSESLSPAHRKKFDSYFKQPHNPEKTQLCSFSLNSPMIKALEPSQSVYRDFVRGSLWLE